LNKTKEHFILFKKKYFLGGIEMPFLAIISMVASVLFYALITITMLRLLKALDIYIKKNKD
jgi:hypothetical protein